MSELLLALNVIIRIVNCKSIIKSIKTTSNKQTKKESRPNARRNKW